MVAVQQLILSRKRTISTCRKFINTDDTLNIIDHLNDNCIPEKDILVSFDFQNKFPSIYNESAIKSVEYLLNARSILSPSNYVFLKVCS